ncbi:adenylate kinase family protein [Euryarchaeota archaeon]|jgi:adenylate kinase|nr:adenylate kinase family protein [Euryarchaeota archaeon]|tara:strand:- start:1263 stop:1802 length:540 start_codon:yes stop_codon:yes gene_type:complete
MDTGRIIAVTGTPGCGKTTLCEALKQAGYAVESVADLARRYDCLGDEDPTDGAAPVDVHKLAEAWQEEPEAVLFVDGHLAHLLDVDAVVILRCTPAVLEKRLAERGYDEAKVKANVEWEMLGGTWSEMLEFELEVPVLELDASEVESAVLCSELLEWIESDAPSDGVEASATEAIDWLA